MKNKSIRLRRLFKILIRKKDSFFVRISNLSEALNSQKKLFLRSSKKDCIYIDASIKYNRYLISLIIFYLLNGNRVVLQYHLDFILHWHKYFQELAGFKHFELAMRAPKRQKLKFLDNSNKNIGIKISPDYFEEYGLNTFHFPFTLHPTMYFKGLSNSPPVKKSAAFLIGFAGNLDDFVYQDISLKKETYLNRNKLIIQIENNFPDILFKPRNYDALAKAINDGGHSQKICIIDTETFRLENKEYLDFLNACKFSICPPGTKMVYCHNLIESMYVGCVPILQYADLMKPKMKHEFNCLAFNDEREFTQRIREVISGEANYEAISRNVRQYYDQHLTPNAVVNKIENLSGSDNVNIRLLCGTAGKLSVDLANY